jgi:Na+/serine symporter
MVQSGVRENGQPEIEERTMNCKRVIQTLFYTSLVSIAFILALIVPYFVYFRQGRKEKLRDCLRLCLLVTLSASLTANPPIPPCIH